MDSDFSFLVTIHFYFSLFTYLENESKKITMSGTRDVTLGAAISRIISLFIKIGQQKKGKKKRTKKSIKKMMKSVITQPLQVQ